MAAHCEDCRWSGSSTEVVGGGRCPECGGQVRYDGKPLIQTVKLSAVEFFPRAAKALRGIYGTESNPFLMNVLPACETGGPLTRAQQNGLYQTVLRLEGQISDRAVVDFATQHARGCD